MDRQSVTEQNRAAWNETAGIHEAKRLNELLEAVARPGFSTLDEVERRVFDELGVQGKAIAQLCCNNGRELLSLKLAGAGRATGFDIADGVVEQGARLASAAGVDIEFVRTSVYDIPHAFDGAFDLVYVTVGALGWLPDLDAFFAIVSRMLRPRGALFIYEMHPCLDMFDTDKGLEVRHSYFRREPFVNENERDYFDPEKRVAARSYWFHHTMADVIGGCLRHGLALERFEEHPHDISTTFAHLEREEIRPPMCYALVARKAGNG
jgi:SAM-dependent methyltransferase